MHSSTIETTVTQTEALSAIVWARLSNDTKRVFAEVEGYAQRENMGEALKTLYRQLDVCTLEDALSAQIHFLTDDYLPSLTQDTKNANRIKRTRQAIDELDKIIDELEYYTDTFNKECQQETSRIHAINPPMRIGRFLPNSVKYIAHSVAIWARECHKIIIPQWDDLGQYDVFDSKLDQEQWSEDARIEARLKVLNALVEGVLNAEIPNRSVRIPKKKYGYVDKPGFRPTKGKNPNPAEPLALNVAGIKDFLEWQFLRISGDKNIRLLSKDPAREILEKWSPERPLSSATVNLYRRPLSKCADLMTAGLAVGLAEDQFAKELKKARPLQWHLPSALTNIQWDAIDGVSEATVKRIVQVSIDKMLKRAKRL